MGEEDQEDHEIEAAEEAEVTLGFLEEASEPRFLRREHFPSKVGGRPAWLDPERIPKAEDVQCERCSGPVYPLLQIYCPLEDIPRAFHRTIYVFVCRMTKCGGVCVLRCQLPRKNAYYAFEYDEDAEELPEANYPVCALCGLRADKHCGKCRVERYCGAQCQKQDWRLGHRECCGKGSATPKLLRAREGWRILEKNLVMELEPEEEDPLDHVQTQVGTLQDASAEEMPEESFQTVDADLVTFQARIAREPEQVLRYGRGIHVLWPFTEGKMSQTTRECLHCNGELVLEFQVLPQLLYYLQADKQNFDFGTLAIFTCKNSCEIDGYQQEFVFRQPPSEIE